MNFIKENKTIITILIVGLVLYLIYYFSKSKETFDNVDHSRDDELATFAYEYLVSPSGIISGYDKYFKFLREALNVNPILSSKDTYETLRDLRKNDKLSKAAIMDLISEKPETAKAPAKEIPF
jgi:hypothetical protein